MRSLRTSTVVATVALTVAVVASGCGKSESDRGLREAAGSPAATATAPPANCQQAPAPGAAVSWVPADLPLPAGTYPVEDVQSGSGSKVAVFVVPMTIHEYVSFALRELPQQGWRLGRGDSEAAEAEDSFTKENQGGSFRVRSVYCDPTRSELRLTYIPDVKAAQAKP